MTRIKNGVNRLLHFLLQHSSFARAAKATESVVDRTMEQERYNQDILHSILKLNKMAEELEKSVSKFDVDVRNADNSHRN
ncbi:hypothetical protein ACQKOF_10160 [Lysinibacillus sp. NPDC093190]|uniref:hypothetical protein n=1 Tax=Lysinibacillus sp. NPDC093190 TaxID=3390575 RepID=UPI003D0806F3